MFFNRVGRDQSEHLDFILLADAMGAILGLKIHLAMSISEWPGLNWKTRGKFQVEDLRVPI